MITHDNTEKHTCTTHPDTTFTTIICYQYYTWALCTPKTLMTHDNWLSVRTCFIKPLIPILSHICINNMTKCWHSPTPSLIIASTISVEPASAARCSANVLRAVRVHISAGFHPFSSPNQLIRAIQQSNDSFEFWLMASWRQSNVPFRASSYVISVKHNV